MAAPYTYLDWAATAPLCVPAREAMQAFLDSASNSDSVWANANSLHSPGRAAFAALEAARAQVADCIKARPDGLAFTSGATESDNAALVGIASAAARLTAKRADADFEPHVIASSIEHDAVLKALDALRRRGFAVSLVKPERNGIVNPDALRAALRPSTVLVSIMLANNEMGAIQPVGAIARIAHEAGAFVHTDAAQALGKIPLSVDDLGVDALSLSAHKVGGPKGVGALYLRPGTPFEAMMLGGGQEGGLRSGTQNVCGTAGFAAACQAFASAEALDETCARMRAARDRLYERLCAVKGIAQTVPCVAGSIDYLPNIVHVVVAGIESETLILKLDERGFAVSGGSACSSHSLEPSHVLMAMGVQSDDALCSLRISFGPTTDEDDLERIATALTDIVSR